jgi:hypothetical protein
LLIDRHLVDKMDNVEFRFHHPNPLPLPKSPLRGAYATVIKDGDLFRAYYRGDDLGYTGPRNYSGHPGEITCYAESRDGHEWTFPRLGLFAVNGTRDNNAIMVGPSPFSHNFSPFLDTRPGVDANERFKALAGHPGFERKVKADGLHSFVSADGIHWKKTGEQPVIPYDMSWSHAFDSQNVSFWSEAEQLYVCYFRVYATYLGAVRTTSSVPLSLPDKSREVGHVDELRSIARSTSPDFGKWSTPVLMNPNLPGEHLYTSQTHPYFRAPHIYIALPSRYVAGRVSSEKTHAMLGSTDILFMSTRAGSPVFDRLFTEAFISPGLDPERWKSRANYVALNVVPTGDAEMSIYHSLSGHRYTLRTDGFISVRAGAKQGELVTKPVIFDGNKLIVNYSTSAAGSLRVEMQEPDGTPIPLFSLEKCELAVGDTVDGHISWQGNPDSGAWAGKPVRLRFVMTECDLYSFRFRPKPTSAPNNLSMVPTMHASPG